MPDVWLALGQFIHQDFLLLYPDFWSGYLEFLEMIECKDRVVLSEYLGKILEDGSTPSTLSDIWERSGADVIPIETDINIFLEQMLERTETASPCGGKEQNQS